MHIPKKCSNFVLKFEKGTMGMRELRLLVATIVAVMALVLPTFLMAAPTVAPATVVAQDTIELTATEVTPELDYNAGNYTFTLQNETWKVQVRYVGNSPYGVFSEDDFFTQSGGGTFNYIRNPRNDMQFWSFKYATITVTNEQGATRIEVNALLNNWGDWRRVLAHGYIPAPAVVDSVQMDLGQVAVQQDIFNEAIIMEAGNEDYHLAFGLGGYTHLAAGDYYKVDLLVPELVNLHTNDTIVPTDAHLSVTANGAYFDLLFRMRSAADTLYIIQMHTGATVVNDTIGVACSRVVASDYSGSYGFVQLAGESADYVVSIGLTPYGMAHLDMVADTSFVYAYTRVVRKRDQAEVRITEARASVLSEINPSGNGCRRTLWADLVGANGTLYMVTMPLDYAQLPAAVDTINVDFGAGVGRVDFSQGMGWMGLVLSKAGVMDAHVAFYNAGEMKGIFDPDMFDYEGCYFTTYTDRMVAFSDIKAAEIRLDSIQDTLHITLDAINMGDTLYHMTAYLAPKRVLTDGDHTYDISYSSTGTGYDMVGLRTYVGSDQYVYHIQFQRADNWTADGEPMGDAEIFDFRLLQKDWDGIRGTYGYSEGNLDAESYHTIYEGGTEIYLGPVAGTLSFNPLQEVMVNLGGDMRYRAFMYAIEAQILAENGQIYRLSGQNVLICIDQETGGFIYLTEAELTALEEVLGEEGWQVRKKLQNGMLLIEKGERTYDAGGRLVK